MARTDRIQFSREEIGRLVLFIYLFNKEQRWQERPLSVAVMVDEGWEMTATGPQPCRPLCESRFPVSPFLSCLFSFPSFFSFLLHLSFFATDFKLSIFSASPRSESSDLAQRAELCQPPNGAGRLTGSTLPRSAFRTPLSPFPSTHTDQMVAHDWTSST